MHMHGHPLLKYKMKKIEFNITLTLTGHRAQLQSELKCMDIIQ